MAAVGDISFHWAQGPKAHLEILRSVRSLWADCDIVIGNLEGPLVQNGSPVDGKCTLKASPALARSFANSGFGLMTLANNHIMDHGPVGLFSTMKALNQAGLPFVGAGKDGDSARSPYYVTLKGTPCAFLARSSVIVSSPCYASMDSPGIAFLDVDEIKAALKKCKRKADIVVLIAHWGVEHYRYPSVSQRKLARELIETGADLIIGHHPHVLQGVEEIGSALVTHSLGNFVFDDIHWPFADREGRRHKRVVRLSEENRKGGILKVNLSASGVSSYDLLPTYIQADRLVRIDATVERKRQVDTLCSRLNWPMYAFFWRLYSMRQEWRLRFKPLIQERLSWSKLKKLRTKHFKELICRLRRSAKITTEKSTNPYE